MKILRLQSWLINLFCLVLLVSLNACQSNLQSLGKQVQSRGATVPRNDREKVIFDYFYALQEERYVDAYHLRAWHRLPSPISLEDFILLHEPNHSSLATKISIHEQGESDLSQTSQCERNYTVYSVISEATVLFSGELELVTKPDEPDKCLIGYNSAFGSLP